MTLPASLNPFENQVYFHKAWSLFVWKMKKCLNPFENQVYFHGKPPLQSGVT